MRSFTGTLLLLYLALLTALALRHASSPRRGPDASPREAALALQSDQRYDPGPAGILTLATRAAADRADAVLTEAVKLAPRWPLYRFGRGLFELRMGRIDRADAAFTLARRLAPRYAGLVQRIAEAWVETALRTKDVSVIPYALPLFRDAAEIDPAMLDRTFTVLGPLAPDPRALNEVVPSRPECRLVYGRRLFRSGHLEEAIRELRRAAAGMGGKSGPACLELGRALLLSGDADGAATAFRQGVELSPHPDETLRALYEDYARAERKADGAELWRSLLERHERAARLNLGRYLFEEGPASYPEAERQLSRADRLRSDPDTDRWLARIELYRKRFAQAEALARRGLLMESRDADLHYLRALALRGLGRREEALGSLEKARNIDPDNPLFANLFAQWAGSEPR